MSKYLRTYSVVVDGTGSSFGTPEDHERDVESLLATLLASKTGKAVIRKIIAEGVVRIIPYNPADPKHRCNAVAPGARHREQVASGITRAAVNVEFSPGTWAPSNGCLYGPGARPDEVLLHELVHAARHLGGDLNQIPLTGPKMSVYTDEEEFFAVLVSNIYISEKGRQPNFWVAGPGNSGLRGGHNSSTLSDDQAMSVDFLSDADNFRLVKKFCGQHTSMAPWISEASARFNPIKVFYRWQKLGIEPRNGVLTRVG